LQLLGTLTLDRGGELKIANSGLNIDGSSGGILNVIAGAVMLESGLVDCSTTTAAKIGSSSSGSGNLALNGGTIQVFQIHFGETGGSLGTLNLSNGTFNCSSLFTLGQSVGSTGVVSVAGGRLMVTNDLTRVGNLGTGLVSIGGGEANFAFLSLGDNIDSSGTVSVSGGKLVIRPRTTNDWLRVGNYGNAKLDINGGTALVLSEFHIADNAGSTGIVSVTGGQLIVTNDITAIGRYGVGEMIVSNSFVQLTNASVGRHDGAIGTLVLQTDGVLTQVDDLSIGRFANSIGHVLVTGGLLALTNDNLWVGREGTGDLIVSNGTVSAQAIFVGRSPDGTNPPFGAVTLAGGTTVVSSNMIIGTTSISTGQVAIVGGSLVVLSPNESGYITVANGTVTLSGGTVAADKLFLTNDAGQFSFAGGQLEIKSATIANGSPFVVGDGITPATLQLQGGAVSFADGLIISSNATVTGCGTIIGSIVNHGTLSTNCGPAAPLITKIVAGGSDATLYFTTLTGLNYVVEYKNVINDTNWTAIAPAVTGNGNVMTITDTNAVAETRFYRVRVQ
jgi:T5SS/PEP-CTERM-associated repeat protein